MFFWDFPTHTEIMVICSFFFCKKRAYLGLECGLDRQEKKICSSSSATKGQTISKANYGFLNSSKKTNETHCPE